jgi:hypothetical protein
MQAPYGKAVAPQAGLEPWRCGGNVVTQASAEDRAGWVLSREFFAKSLNPGRGGHSPRPKTPPARRYCEARTGPARS